MGPIAVRTYPGEEWKLGSTGLPLNRIMDGAASCECMVSLSQPPDMQRS
jgi:hypothetical protein